MNNEIDEWEYFQEESDETRNIILTYKTKQCQKSNCEYYNKTVANTVNCEFFHSLSDKRRRPFNNQGKLVYTFTICNNPESCGGEKCQYSHNIYEGNYHPRKYRTEKCAHYESNDLDKQESIFKVISSNSEIDKRKNSEGETSIGLGLITQISEANNKQENTPSFKINDHFDSKISNFVLNPMVSISNVTMSHTERFCCFYHRVSERRNTNIFNNSPLLYRDDISNTKLTKDNLIYFKINKCSNKQKHSEKQCFYFHSTKDKRRNQNLFNYSADLCSSEKCSKGDNCSFSHNQVEMFYHQEKFRTKFCSYFTEHKPISEISLQCPYGELCSFAHSESEITISLLDKMVRGESFYLYHFKTVQCPYSKHHDKSNCVYSHNYQDYRRNPLIYYYDKEKCSNWNNKSTITYYEQECSKGLKCKLTHGWKEFDYHPLVYKTAKCKRFYENYCDKGESCPFLHNNEKKRVIHSDILKYYDRSNSFNNYSYINNNQNTSFKSIYSSESPDKSNLIYQSKSFKNINTMNYSRLSNTSNKIESENNKFNNSIYSLPNKLLFYNKSNSNSLTNRSLSPLSSDNGSSKLSIWKPHNADYSIDLECKNVETKQELIQHIDKTNTELKSLFAADVLEEINSNLNENEESLMTYLYSNKLYNLMDMIEKGTLRQEKLFLLPEDEVLVLLEEENKEKLSDLMNFLVKQKDSEIEEDILKQISKTMNDNEM